MNARLSPRLLLLLFCLGATAWTRPAGAAMTTPRIVNMKLSPAPNGERFLFVIDASAGMEDIQASTEASLFELIRTGVNGYMRAGDTYGIWTFNKVTDTSRLSMQVWDPKRSTQLATIASGSINNQVYEKSCKIKQMMETLATVIHAVSNLNVFVITDGDTDMAGTPFDKAINAEYRKQHRLRKQTQRPFVTAFVVRDGWFVNGLVRIAGQAIDLPERAPPLLAQTNPPQAATSVMASANNSPPPPPPQPAPAPPPRKVIQIVTKTNEPRPVSPTETASLAEPITPPSTSAPAPAALARATPPPAGPATLPPPVPAPSVTITATPAASAIASTAPPATPATPGASLAPPSPAPSAAPSTALAPPSAAASVPPSLAPPAPGAELLRKLTPEATPMRVAARERMTAAASPARPELVDPAPFQSSTPTPAGVAALLPAPLAASSSAAMGWMLVFGAGLLVVAALLLLLVRRVRSHGAGSLITQSMDRR